MKFQLDPDIQAELQLLIDNMLDRGLGDDQLHRLNEILQDDEALEFYVSYMEFQGELSWRYRGEIMASTKQPDAERTAFVPTRTRWSQVVASRSFISFACCVFVLAFMASTAVWWISVLPKDLAQPFPKGGGNITAEQIQDAVLIPDRIPGVSWIIDGSDLRITSDTGSLPGQLIVEILGDSGDHSSPSTISASWELGNDNRHLHLFDLEVDGVAAGREVNLPIILVSELRIKIGELEYDVLPGNLAN